MAETYYPLGDIIKMTRDCHMVDIASITLIDDMDNEPISAPAVSSEVANFDCSEGRDIISAVQQYNQDVPRQKIVRVNGGPYSFYLDNLVPGWDNRNHKVLRLKYPLEGARESWLSGNSWRQTLDEDDGRPMLQFMDRSLVGGFGMLYSCLHIFDVGLNRTTIPPEHWEYIAHLAASKVLRKASVKCAGFGSQIAGYSSKDLSNMRSQYLESAKEAAAYYEQLIQPDTPPLAPTWVSWGLQTDGGYRLLRDELRII